MFQDLLLERMQITKKVCASRFFIVLRLALGRHEIPGVICE